MQPINRQRIDDSVYEQLLQNIKSGKWKSGDKLPSEAELCAILGISRVSVRSALQRLQAIGLIEVKRGKGSYVRSSQEMFDFSGFTGSIEMTYQEADEISQLRDMLEAKSVELLLSRQQPADFTRLTEAFEGMGRAAEKMDLDEYTLHDHKFHIAIIVAAGNSKLIQVAQIFQEDFYRFIHENNKLMLRDKDDPDKGRRYFEDTQRRHRLLYDAILNSHPDAVEVQKSFIEGNLRRLEHYYAEKEKQEKQ